jgi:uncharacterized protein
MPATTTIEIRVKPGAKNDCITLHNDGSFAVAVTSPPIDGRANEHVIKLFSKKLRIPKSSIEIIKGENYKSKVIKIENLNLHEILIKLKG